MIYFLYDSDGYYLGNSNIETENSTTIEPTLKDGYWSRFNGKKWTTEKIAESAADLDGVIIPDIALEGVSASNHDKELYSLFERYLDDSSYIVKDAENKTLTFKVLTDEDLLQKAKSSKLEELKIISQKFTVNNCEEMYLTSSLGYAINADKTAQDNIRGLIEAHEETDLIKYKLYDNTFKDVTIADLKIMLKECAQNGENLYTQKFLYQAKINACTSIEEVNAIEIAFEMMDFSKSDTETDSE